MDRPANSKSSLEQFTNHTGAASWIALAIDLVFYAACVGVAVLASNVAVKIVAVILGGVAISRLFILGHDSAHRALVPQRHVNDVLTRLVFLPCLHNATLWWVQHNWAHHQYTNVRGLNSFSPMSPSEYRAARFGRRLLERFYRNPLGFGVYYLIERWWKHKFIPWSMAGVRSRAAAWRDLAILLAWLAAFVYALIALDAAWGEAEPLSAVLWGFVLPFLVWNQLMGTTAWLQHTHPSAPWSERDGGHRSGRFAQLDVTVLVEHPRWYDALSHNIMQHPAHHANPRIPWHRLRGAQRHLIEVAAEAVIVERMTPGYLVHLVRVCQLFDYERRRWVRYGDASASVTNVQPVSHET